MKVIKKGLNIPLTGAPVQEVGSSPETTHVALVGDDYVGMKPTMLVQVGDRVKLGQPVLENKKSPGMLFCSPGAGEVVAINRGEKRKFESLVVRLEGDEEETFQAYEEAELSSLGREKVVEQLVQSGQWTSFRTRPFDAVPSVDSTPHSIFVTSIDTNPGAADPEPIISENRAEFAAGLKVLTQLTDGPVFLCIRAGAQVPGEAIEAVKVEEFSGPHPAGLPGTHIHFLDPVGPNKTVWHVNYQDTIAIGALFLTGRLRMERVVALSGPVASKPRLIKTRLGADLGDLTRDESSESNLRVISGSCLAGRTMEESRQFLGRYHLQISLLKQGNEREFLGWQKPGFNRFSVTRAFASALTPGKKFALTTSTEGSKRAMVPIGTYETVMPLDILPTQLLRAIIVGDTEEAQSLGALELSEEDLALCTFVCPGKYDYGSILRANLSRIEKEG